MTSTKSKLVALGVTALVVVVLAAAVGWSFLTDKLNTISVTAQFDSAAGLYEGNNVAVLGMRVGQVTKIVPKGGYVEVEFSLDGDVKVPADAMAVTISNSILTDRQIELTPAYRGGPTLENHDTIGLNRTRTPVEFARVLDVLDKLSTSLRGDGNGGGPIASVVDSSAAIADGNGQAMKDALGELSNALRLSSDRGAVTRDQLTEIIRNVSTLFQAAADNDATLRDFGSTVRQLSQILADEDFGSGTTGKKLNEVMNNLGEVLETHREAIKQIVNNGNTALTTTVEHQRDLMEFLDLTPLTLDNIYNAIDRTNGAVRVHVLTDKVLFDTQTVKEMCNMMGLRQLGCSTGTLQDFGPDFGLSYVLDGARGDGAEVMTNRPRAVLALTLTACLSVSACASEGLASLPLPAPGGGSGGYTLTAVFSNALNLPAMAKVKLSGADVGELESMEARNYTAVTTLRIRDGVQLPKGSTAELRSATPLGDVFVAIKPPASAQPDGALLRDGDTLDLESTTAAATVESVLSSAAILVNGGAVRNLTNIINGLGKATGDQGQAFGNLIRKTNHTLGTLNSRSEEISTAMTETSRLVEQLETRNQALSEMLDAAGPATNTLAAHTNEITDLVMQIGDTSELLRKFPSIAGTDTSGRSVVADANTIAGAWNDVALAPDASLYSLNRLMPPFVKSTTSNAIAVRASIDRLVLGSIPDIGFTGDPGLHGPKRYNWHQLVGSLRYTLLRLQERIVGKGPGVPQVPVMPSPTEPGVIVPAPPLAPPPPVPAPPAPPPPVPAPAPVPSPGAP